MNSGQDDDGNLDHGHWFRREDLACLAYVVSKDINLLENVSEHERAIARRAVIFICDKRLYDPDSVSASVRAAAERWSEQMQNATAW